MSTFWIEKPKDELLTTMLGTHVVLEGEVENGILNVMAPKRMAQLYPHIPIDFVGLKQVEGPARYLSRKDYQDLVR